MKTAIQCGKMFDSVAGKTLENVVILVEDARIVNVVSAATAGELADYQKIDLSEQYVTPGLIDCHVHLNGNGEGNTLGVRPYLTVGGATLNSMQHAQFDLLAGFTSLRTCGDLGYSDVALRDAINKGDVWGPRLMVCGSNISSTGGHSDSHYNPYLYDTVRAGTAGDGRAGMMRRVRENVKHGVDYIKFMATGGVMSLGTEVGAQQMTYDECRAIIETAEMYGMITATHAHGTSGIKTAARAGVTSVEHGMMMDEECITIMKQNGTYLVPTIIAAERIVTMGPSIGTPQWAIDKANQVLARHQWGFNRCLEEGIPIAFGSDATTPYNFHGKQGYEFELLMRFGMTAEQALVCATLTASKLLRRDGEVGSIEKGKYADIAAFSGDPTRAIQTMTDCQFVMKGGTIYKQNGVATMLS